MTRCLSWGTFPAKAPLLSIFQSILTILYSDTYLSNRWYFRALRLATTANFAAFCPNGATEFVTRLQTLRGAYHKSRSPRSLARPPAGPSRLQRATLSRECGNSSRGRTAHLTAACCRQLTAYCLLPGSLHDVSLFAAARTVSFLGSRSLAVSTSRLASASLPDSR